MKITGIGLLNALGLDAGEFWPRLLGGSAGIAPVEGFETEGCASNLGGEVRGFVPKRFMTPGFYRRLGRLSRLAVAASIEAVRDAGLPEGIRERVGAAYGTAFGSTEQTDAFYTGALIHGPQAAEPMLFPETVPNAPAAHVSIYHRLQGPNSTFCQNHLSGECALAYAASLLDMGAADAVLVGGVDELSPILFHSLDAIGALKRIHGERPLPPESLLPGRGFIAGEGAVCLVLEPDGAADAGSRAGSVALGRGYGTLRAAVLTGFTTPQGRYDAVVEGLREAVRMALDEARLLPEDIDIIGLAANGVAPLEEGEGAALDAVFGERLRSIPMVPLRYFIGDFGSAGLMSAAVILLALREGATPPHWLGPRRRGGPDAVKLNPSKKAAFTHGLVIGATYGGGAACVVLSRAGA